MTQLDLPIKLTPIYYRGLALKPRKGFSHMFRATGRKVRKFIVGHNDGNTYIRIHESNLCGFYWLLTEREIEKFFTQY